MRYNGRARIGSRPATGVQVHREGTGVKEEPKSMGDLRDRKAEARGFKGPDGARFQGRESYQGKQW